MGLPAKRRTKQSKRERAAHFALKKFTLATCSHCKRKIRPHQVCRHCGYYKGREVVKMKLKSAKKVKAKKEAKTDTAETTKKEDKK